MEEEDKISKKRNEDIQRRLNKIDACLKDITLPDEKLDFLKVGYLKLLFKNIFLTSLSSLNCAECMGSLDSLSLFLANCPY